MTNIPSRWMSIVATQRELDVKVYTHCKYRSSSCSVCSVWRLQSEASKCRSESENCESPLVGFTRHSRKVRQRTTVCFIQFVPFSSPAYRLCAPVCAALSKCFHRLSSRLCSSKPDDLGCSLWGAHCELYQPAAVLYTAAALQ